MSDESLRGVRILELPALGPVPHATTMLADLGAEVTRIERPGHTPRAWHAHPRSTSVELDLRSERGADEALSLVARHDVLVEGLRPGAAERLGLGPAECFDRNPRLVYARLSGWGRAGTMAGRAGHDLNYVGMSGVLSAITDADGTPVVPLNAVGDGAAALLLVTGILSALLARERDDRGRVVDVGIIAGALQVSSLIWRLRAAGAWQPRPVSNRIDGGAPYYALYRCSDGRHMAVGALEDAFYAQFVRVLGLDPALLPDRDARSNWPALRAVFAERISTRTRDEWTAAAEQVDACFTPVLDMDEASRHPDLIDAGLFAPPAVDAPGLPRAMPHVQLWPGR